jgi:hypothetical protein
LPVHVITPPASEPVTLAEVKAQLDVDLGLRDAELNDTITAAREYVELTCRRALVTQTWELVLDRFANEDPLSIPARPLFSSLSSSIPPWWYGIDYLSEPWSVARYRPWIELPFGALASVGSVTYVDQGGTLQTLTPVTDYAVDAVHVPGRVYPAPLKSWPVPRAQWDAVKVQYIVGDAVNSVPKSIKQAVMLLIRAMWRHGTDAPAAAQSISFSFEALLAPHRIMRV